MNFCNKRHCFVFMLQIDQSTQRDGFTFSLNPRSKKVLNEQEPAINPLPRIFIAFNTADDFQTERGDLFEHIAQLLTRLSESELIEKFGGYEIIDPITGRSLYMHPNA